MGNFLETVNLSIEGAKGWTPLHTAAKLDFVDCAQALLRNGAKVCKQCNNGLNALHIAARCGSAKTLDLILGQCTYSIRPQKVVKTV